MPYLRLSFLILTLAFSVAVSSAARADDVLTCEATTEKVLTPFLDAVAAAEAGERVHAEESAKTVAAIDVFVTTLYEAQTVFSDHLAATKADFAERLDAAEAERIRVDIADLSAAHSRGELPAHAPRVGYTASTTAWRDYIAKISPEKAEDAARHGAGEVALYIPVLGHAASWNDTETRLVAEDARRADTLARLNAYYMPTIGHAATGAEIDALLAERQANLADARARITAGTFALYVPSFGQATDRNTVAQAKADFEAETAAVRAGWDDGSFIIYNPLVGHAITKGEIETALRDAEDDLVAYIAAADGSVASVDTLGNSSSGRAILESMAKAETAEARQTWRNHYSAWQIGRGKVIEGKRAGVETH